MSTSTSPALRLHSKITAFLGWGGKKNLHAIEAWIQVLATGSLGLPHRPQVSALHHRTIRMVGELHAQVELCRRLAVEKDLRPSLYQQRLDRLAVALSPDTMFVPYQQVAAYFTDDLLTALEYLHEMLDAGERALPDEVLQYIVGEINDIEKAIRDAELSPDLRAFLLAQVDAIRTAVRDYPLKERVRLSEPINVQFGTGKSMRTLSTNLRNPRK